MIHRYARTQSIHTNGDCRQGLCVWLWWTNSKKLHECMQSLTEPPLSHCAHSQVSVWLNERQTILRSPSGKCCQVVPNSRQRRCVIYQSGRWLAMSWTSPECNQTEKLLERGSTCYSTMAFKFKFIKVRDSIITRQSNFKQEDYFTYTLGSVVDSHQTYSFVWCAVLRIWDFMVETRLYFSSALNPFTVRHARTNWGSK